VSSDPSSPSHAPAGPFDVDPDELQRLKVETKRALRARLRAVRAALPASAAAARSQSACERLAALPAIVQARSVALYAAIAGSRELDLEALDAMLRARGVAVYYPFVDRLGDRRRTGFRLTRSRHELGTRGQRFAEPPPSAIEAAPGSLDVIVVAALGVAPDGHRLGQGAGWYDATLPEHCPPAVAVAAAFDFQLLAEIPAERHDVRTQWVVTDTRTLDAEASRALTVV
jgi:5-formyltetrahydrofolate cyclo-ligase